MKIKKTTTPNLFKIIISLTNFCNYSCNYCVVNAPNTGKIINSKKLLLFVNYINKYLSNHTQICYTLSGGEPLLHPNISEIVSILQSTNNLTEIRILTNGSLPFEKIFNNIKNINVGITLHYKEMNKTNNFDKNFKNLLKNIEYLYTHNNTASLRFMLEKELSNDTIKNCLSQFISIIKEFNMPIEYSLAHIFPTDNYIIPNFDYTILENIYNKYGANNITYPFRVIKIDIDYNFSYACELVKNFIKFHNISILYKENFIYISTNINKTIVCTFKECDCGFCMDILSKK